jgi:VWFA-related protein
MRFLRQFTAALVALAPLAFCQQPLPNPAAPTEASTIKVDAKLVVVPAIVRDKHNALVAGLGRDSFTLQVDGKPQAIRYFDHDADVPLTVGLLIDTSMSQRNVLDDERSASASFLDKMMAPDRDQAFLIEFARAVTLLQDVTASRGKLQQALKQVDAAEPSFQPSANGGSTGSDPNDSQGGHRGRMGGAGTALYDSVFLASDEVISKQKGRRALILLTDGDDHGSLKNLAQSIESAQRADTIIYAIYYKDDHPGYGGGGGGPFGGGMGGHHGGMGGPGGGGGGRGGGYGQQRVDGKKILERMCGETGGRLFEVSKKETVEKIYSEIGEELRSQYRLGFSPTADAASEGYHQIVLNLTGPAAKEKDMVQARDGYYR